jgi:hypothetical protein
MEDYQESVVEASVDAEQYESSEVRTSETDVNTEVVAPTTEEPKFGEALKAELARREAQLEKKYKEQYGDYDSIKSQSKSLEKRARQEGFDDVQAYLKAIDEFEQQQQIQAEASKYGVPEDFIRAELQPLKSELEQLRQEREKFQQNEVVRQVDSEIATLSQKYDDFAGMKDEVLNFAIEKGYRLEDAYRLMTYEAKMEAAALKKEQETLARITGRDAKQVLPSKDSPNNVQFDPANMSFEEIKALSQRVQSGERITF